MRVAFDAQRQSFGQVLLSRTSVAGECRDGRAEHDFLGRERRKLRDLVRLVDQGIKIAVELDRRDIERRAVGVVLEEGTQRDVIACRGVLEQRQDKGFDLNTIRSRRRLVTRVMH
jgi:hypothetical protein